MAFVTKGNDEIAIGFRPEQLLTYCLNVDVLHREGAEAQLVDLLTRAASLEQISESENEISNGLCLSPTYHRAYDRGLIYLDEALTMQINPAREQELIQAGHAGGLTDFKQYLGKRIHLPVDRLQWPKLHFVRRANKMRGIQLQ